MKVMFNIEVWITPGDLEQDEADQRSARRLLEEEIQSNLESLRGVIHVEITSITNGVPTSS